MSNDSKGITERIEVAGDQLVSKVNEIVREGNARRIILRDGEGKELLSVPLNVGVAGAGLTVLAMPGLAAIGALAALVAKVHVEIERGGDKAADVVETDSSEPDSAAAGDAGTETAEATEVIADASVESPDA